MAVGNIFNYSMKTEVSTSLQGISIAIAGQSKCGKSTFCSSASRPIFLQTEIGDRNLTGITPIPIATFNDFKSAVNQLCTPQGRETFDTVVIDSVTNLLLILDKSYAAKASELEGTDKNGVPITLENASDASYGKGTKLVKTALSNQLQKLSNFGFLLLLIVHLEEKTNFDTGKTFISPTISASLNNLIERFVDQTIYLTGKGGINHQTHFTPKGGYSGTGGRFTMLVDSIPTDFAAFEKVLKEGITAGAKSKGIIATDQEISSKLENPEYDYLALKAELSGLFKEITEAAPENAEKIKTIVAAEIGSGRKATEIQIEHVENLFNIIEALKKEFKINKIEGEQLNEKE